MNTMKYQARGHVYGYYWGGGAGAYPSKLIQADTIEELRERINDGIEKGWLDSGMGYESLIGAIIYITRIETMQHEGKEWHTKDESVEFFGNLTDDQKEFLENCLF